MGLYNERPESTELAANLVGKYLTPAHAKKLKYLSFKESLQRCDINEEAIGVVSRDNFQGIRDGIFRDIAREGDSVIGNHALVQAIIYENLARYGKPITPEELAETEKLYGELDEVFGKPVEVGEQ